MRRLVMLGALLVASCAPQMQWTKAGFNAVDWQRDTYECERDTRAGAASFGSTRSAEAFYARCLQAKGYELVERGQPTREERERQREIEEWIRRDAYYVPPPKQAYAPPTNLSARGTHTCTLDNFGSRVPPEELKALNDLCTAGSIDQARYDAKRLEFWRSR